MYNELLLTMELHIYKYNTVHWTVLHDCLIIIMLSSVQHLQCNSYKQNTIGTRIHCHKAAEWRLKNKIILLIMVLSRVEVLILDSFPLHLAYIRLLLAQLCISNKSVLYDHWWITELPIKHGIDTIIHISRPTILILED